MTPAFLYEMNQLGRVFIEGGQSVLALSELSLNISFAQFVAICGPSGAGKSTLLHILGLLDDRYTGQLALAGTNVRQLSVSEATQLRLRRIGFVFQRHHLLEAMTVLENVAWPHWKLHGSQSEAYRRAMVLLEDLGMAHRANHRPIKLSGGELQRVALARAIVNRPDVILADEPTAQLDEENAVHIVTLLQRLVAEGHSVVAVTHDQKLVDAADATICLKYGRLTKEGEMPR